MCNNKRAFQTSEESIEEDKRARILDIIIGILARVE